MIATGPLPAAQAAICAAAAQLARANPAKLTNVQLPSSCAKLGPRSSEGSSSHASSRGRSITSSPNLPGS
jgi:hypothetical protein